MPVDTSGKKGKGTDALYPLRKGEWEGLASGGWGWGLLAGFLCTGALLFGEANPHLVEVNLHALGKDRYAAIDTLVDKTDQ